MSDCVHIQVSPCCGNRWCGKGYIDGTSLPLTCDRGCPDYAAEPHKPQLESLPCVEPKISFDCAFKDRCRLWIGTCPVEQWPSCGFSCLGNEQVAPNPEASMSKCIHKYIAANRFSCIKYQIAPAHCGLQCDYYESEKPPSLSSRKCAFSMPFCVSQDCDDCENYKLIANESQPRRPRPFVRVGDVLIMLDDFSAFDIDKHQSQHGQSGYAIVVGIGPLGHWIPIIEYEPMPDIDTGQLAQDALDKIQAAIECWNRAATEPERNVRLMSITENLDYPAAKNRMKETFSEMGIDSNDGKITVQLWQVWAALSGTMLLTEDFDVP